MIPQKDIRTGCLTMLDSLFVIVIDGRFQLLLLFLLEQIFDGAYGTQYG